MSVNLISNDTKFIRNMHTILFTVLALFAMKGNDTGDVRTCNIGIECWEKCGKQDGWCEWCKDGDGDGLCCRQGYEGNGCNGKMGEKYKHTCIQDPASK